MRLNFEDFNRKHFYDYDESESQVLARVNQWLDANDVDVINVETIIVAENVHFTGFRVWYR